MDFNLGSADPKWFANDFKGAARAKGSGPQPEENAKGAIFCEGGEQISGKIVSTQLHLLCSRCFRFHHAFLNQFQKKSSKVLYNLTERFDSV